VPLQQIHLIGHSADGTLKIAAGLLRIAALDLAHARKVESICSGAGIVLDLDFSQAHIVDDTAGCDAIA
jgi:hypothetical protein